MTVTIYKTTNCAWCPAVMKFLDYKHIKYTTINLDDKPDVRDFVIKKTGMLQVPVTVVGDWEKWVVGYNALKLAELVK